MNPLGQHIQVRLGDDVFEQSIREIVGVVGDTKIKNLTSDAQPEYYLPYAQAVITNPFLVIRTAGEPALHSGFNTCRSARNRSECAGLPGGDA